MLALQDVCFAPVNGHRSSRTPCLKSANCGYATQRIISRIAGRLG